MARIVAFFLQLAVAVLVTAAGLYFDVKSLAIFGIGLCGLAVILALWLLAAGQSPVSRAPVNNHQLSTVGGNVAPKDLDEKERAVSALRRALENAKSATPFFSGIDRTAALNRLRAAYGPVATHYRLPNVEISAVSVRSLLKSFIGYIETFLPLLEDRQPAAARNAAITYVHWMSD